MDRAPIPGPELKLTEPTPPPSNSGAKIKAAVAIVVIIVLIVVMWLLWKDDAQGTNAAKGLLTGVGVVAIIGVGAWYLKNT